jgi:hypothetical protein
MKLSLSHYAVIFENESDKEAINKWFTDRPNIQLIKCPSSSPDLNQIKNVWLWLKMQLRNTKASNMVAWTKDITETRLM